MCSFLLMTCFLLLILGVIIYCPKRNYFTLSENAQRLKCSSFLGRTKENTSEALGRAFAQSANYTPENYDMELEKAPFIDQGPL